MKSSGLFLSPFVLAACLLAASCGSASSDGLDIKGSPYLALGYSTGSTEAIAAIDAYADYLHIVSADHYALDASGNLLEGDGTDDTLALCAEAGLEVYACVSNFSGDDFDGAIAHAVVTTYRAQVIDSLTALAVNGPFDGINVDLEAVYAADRDSFSLFVEGLAAKLQAKGKKLIVSVPAKEEDDPADEWAGAFDYGRLADAVDYLQLMTYDEHGPWSEAGSVAGLAWMRSCVDYAISVASANRLLLGLPAYGYDWNLTAGGAASISQKEAVALLASTGASQTRDAETRSVSFTYTADAMWHVVYWEDDQAIKEKSALAMEYGLAGIAVWAFGQEDGGFWEAAWRGLLDE